MSADGLSTTLPDDLGFEVAIDGTQSLPELTGTVNTLCDQVRERSAPLVVVLRLQGAPADSRSWPGPVSVSEVNRWERAVRRLENLPAVTLGVAQETCGGAALDLLLTTDFRIGAVDMRLMLPINDGHFWPGMSMHRLVQQLGVARARQIVLWGMDLPVRSAWEMGLIDQISDDVDDAVRTATVLTGRVSDGELAVRRQLLFEAAHTHYDDALGPHLAACDRELRRLRGDNGEASQ